MGYLLALYPGKQVFCPFPTTTTSSGTFRFITRSDYLAYYTAWPVCQLCWLLLLLLCSYSSYSRPITTNHRLFVFIFYFNFYPVHYPPSNSRSGLSHQSSSPEQPEPQARKTAQQGGIWNVTNVSAKNGMEWDNQRDTGLAREEGGRYPQNTIT